VCILFVSFNFKLLKSKLTTANILCLVRFSSFRSEHISGVTDSVPEQRRPDRTISSGQAKLYVVGIGILIIFGSCDLDLDRKTFIYELNPYPLDIYWMRKNERPTSRLSKVIT